MATALQKTALTRALALLDAAGVRYAVLEDDGTKHGVLEVAAPKGKVTRPRRTDVKHGELWIFLGNILDGCPAGQERVVPYAPYWTDNHKGAQSNVAGWCSAHWGTGGTYISSSQVDGVHVLRISEEGTPQ